MAKKMATKIDSYVACGSLKSKPEGFRLRGQYERRGTVRLAKLDVDGGGRLVPWRPRSNARARPTDPRS
jgi:hypothetical protein